GRDSARSHVSRWPLGTTYTQIVAELREMFGAGVLAGSTLVIDGTGVGAAVVEMIERGHISAAVEAWTITAGLEVNRQKRTVPKKDLVDSIQAGFGEKTLHIRVNRPLSPLLVAGPGGVR